MLCRFYIGYYNYLEKTQLQKKKKKSQYAERFSGLCDRYEGVGRSGDRDPISNEEQRDDHNNDGDDPQEWSDIEDHELTV